jgi:hypothetical protein
MDLGFTDFVKQKKSGGYVHKAKAVKMVEGQVLVGLMVVKCGEH